MNNGWPMVPLDEEILAKEQRIMEIMSDIKSVLAKGAT